MAKSQYSDDDKASALLALQANGGNISLTAKQLGIPRKTLEEWSRGNGVCPAVAEIRQGKRQDLSERLEDVAHKLVDAMPDKMKDANLQQVSVSLGIAVEKMRLLREQSTSIAGNDITDAERLARLNALYERVRARGIRPAIEANGSPLH